MCVMSMIGDHYGDRWRQNPAVLPPQTFVIAPQVSREEFDALRLEVEEMKALLIRAKRYDEEHGEPGCEMDEKLVILRRVAELVGVDLEDVLTGESA